MEDPKNAELESLRQHVTNYLLYAGNCYRDTMMQHGQNIIN